MKVLVRYHEIALKGKNRPFFIQGLVRNLRRALADVEGVRTTVVPGRISLDLPDGVEWAFARERLGAVFGVANFSLAQAVDPDLDALKAAAVDALRARRFASFRVTSKRSDKRFPLTSVEIDRELGRAVQDATGARVDLEQPELTLFVEVLRDRIFYSVEKVPGPGGFPVGTSGRVAALLSGGIDSPVAAYRLMKRGCKVVFVHFHAFPLQDRTTIDKTRALARILTRFQFKSRLLLVPFGPVQQQIVAACPAPLRVVLYRRFMVRIAEALAARQRARALVTGESLGQVASQTLDNVAVIDEAARGPVLRPLIGMDKEEITREARRIGTFDVSTLPDQDCCQLFVPKSPATAATADEVRRAEEGLDGRSLIDTAIAHTEQERFSFPEPGATG
jgi:tRNA uracil 4-sulfurtransferase